jgi:hypothetical protein
MESYVERPPVPRLARRPPALTEHTSAKGFLAASLGCQTAGMEDTQSKSEEAPVTGAAMSRRVFFGRAVGMAGAATALLGLTACPGGDQDDDGDDDDDDD